MEKVIILVWYYLTSLPMMTIQVGNHLRFYRERRALSQRELAEKSRVGKNTVWRIEKAEIALPFPRTRQRLAQALDVEVCKVFPPLKIRSSRT